MEKLRKFYSSWITKIISSIVSIIFGYLLSHPNQELTRFLSFSIISFLTFNLIELLVKHYLWIIFYPKYYFRGDWEGETKYYENGTLVSQKHSAKISQDCISIKVEPSQSLVDSDEAFSWWSIAMEINDRGVEMLYYVERTSTSKRNKNTYGREEWFVAEYKNLFKLPFLKIPLKVKGKFYQCIDDEEPVYQGDIEYTKK